MLQFSRLQKQESHDWVDVCEDAWNGKLGEEKKKIFAETILILFGFFCAL